ncbi:MAG: TonB-dependent receptor [Bacteroidales bacterium]
MKKKIILFLTLLLNAMLYAQTGGITGVLVDAQTGKPVPGANVMLRDQNRFVVSGPLGDFRLSNVTVGTDLLSITSRGYATIESEVKVASDKVTDLGVIKIAPTENPYDNDEEALITFDESQLDDEAGNSQSIGNLSGASDDVYLRTASYAFGATRFRIRGYDSEYYKTYINGIDFNDPARGSFNYSMLGGMNYAFRNKVITNGLEAASFSFGDLGGVTNISTRASEYAPGVRFSGAYTNRNYHWRGMVTYATGLRPNGWAFVASAITRYADEGIVPGTFYESYGYFLSAEKFLNERSSFTISTFGAPTRRGQASATYEECYSLTGNNLYNPNWGYQNGKKRNSRVVEAFDPAIVLSYEWKPKRGTTFNAGAGFRYSNYASSALNWYNAPDPRPDYYRRLPSFFTDQSAIDLYTDLWENDVNFRQVNWDNMYAVNRLNNWENEKTGSDLGSTYIVENRHSNQANYMLNASLNTRLSDFLTLQGGMGLKYTDASYYKTIDDLLGGQFWLDVDQYAERDFPNNPDVLQNNLNNPNHKAKAGDVFGYDYNIRNLKANIWAQNTLNLPHWDIDYAVLLSYSQFMRHGNMRNGRAPENSYGNGSTHRYVNYGVKAGVTYKLDGRNYFMVNAMYETRAPHFGQAYLSPKVKDNIIPDLKSERVVGMDLTYRFQYRKFQGRLTGFYSDFYDQTETSSFFHDQYQTFVNYILTGVHKTYKGIELGVAYKVYPDVTLTFVGTVARYQYKNRPTGITNYENGSLPDTAQVVYLKNYNVGGTPQEAFNVGINWAAPNQWFFDVNLCYFDRAYVDISPVRRTRAALSFPWEGSTAEEIESNYKTKAEEITHQQELKGGFMLNASIGKLIYIQRKYALNLNVSVSNILNKRDIQTGGYEQGRFDYSTFDVNRYPNKYYYAQGINVFVNVGFKF